MNGFHKMAKQVRNLGIHLMILTGLTTGLTDCRHKEFYELKTIILRIEFDWEEAPEANPEGMCLYFYPVDGSRGNPIRFDLPGHRGGTVEIPEGQYHLICYNNDARSVLRHGLEGFHTHFLTTRQADLLEPVFGSMANTTVPHPGAPDEPAMLEPEAIWGCGIVNIRLNEGEVEYEPLQSGGIPGMKVSNDNHLIVAKMQPLTCHYSVKILEAPQHRYISWMCGVLSGLSPSVAAASGNVSDKPVCLPFMMHPDGQGGYDGEFITFGYSGIGVLHNSLALFTSMTDDSNVIYTFDVTPQVLQAPNPRRVHITVETLPQPQPREGGFGFTPTVDSWLEIECEINL